MPTPLPQLPAAAPVASAPAPVNDDAAVRKVVADYARAITDKDVDLFRSVMANFSSDDERRLRAAFQSNQKQRLEITIESVEVRAAEANVKLTRRDSIDDHTITSQQTMGLAKGSSGWVIKRISK